MTWADEWADKCLDKPKIRKRDEVLARMKRRTRRYEDEPDDAPKWRQVNGVWREVRKT